MIFSSEEVNTIMKAKTFIKNTIYFDIPFSQPIIVAGGFISSAIFKSSKDQLNVPSREGDVDIFILCPDDKSFTKSYGEFQQQTAKYAIKEKRFIHKSKNSYVTNLNPHVRHVIDDTVTSFQYIFVDYPTREDMLADFDYVHCCGSYDKNTDKLYLTREIYDAIVNKILIEKKKPHDWRREKFLKRGFVKKDERI